MVLRFYRALRERNKMGEGGKAEDDEGEGSGEEEKREEKGGESGEEDSESELSELPSNEEEEEDEREEERCVRSSWTKEGTGDQADRGSFSIGCEGHLNSRVRLRRSYVESSRTRRRMRAGARGRATRRREIWIERCEEGERHPCLRS